MEVDKSTNCIFTHNVIRSMQNFNEDALFENAPNVQDGGDWVFSNITHQNNYLYFRRTEKNYIR